MSIPLFERHKSPHATKVHDSYIMHLVFGKLSSVKLLSIGALRVQLYENVNYYFQCYIVTN
uniref:Uncharacterized protein n=1 Tax=Arundo donax TaxID=35708 RepID=A0A0A9FN42_ARUDO